MTVATPKETIWPLEPHTKAKHEILQNYLDAWFPILGTYNDRIVYIDGFSGPGEYKGGEPGAPIIALETANRHRGSRTGELVFWFIEDREDRVANLQRRIDAVPWPKHFTIHAEQGIFAEKLKSVLDQLDVERSQLAPTFTLIDPSGFPDPLQPHQTTPRDDSSLGRVPDGAFAGSVRREKWVGFLLRKR